MRHVSMISGHPISTGFRGFTGCQRDPRDRGVSYPADMHPDERDEYREAVRASKASEWNREQAEGLMRGKRKIGKSLYLIYFFT